MRQIVLDTETTGLEWQQGHRIIELGAIEVVNRRLTGRTFHKYFKPDRVVDAGALQVHGITNEFLNSQPRFEEMAAELLDFISGAELIIHNSAFDVAFLDAEFGRLGGVRCRIAELCGIFDTLHLARKMHPGQRNTLDALCKRYSIDNSHREFHGALLDAKLLLDVYLAMTGGQAALTLGEAVMEMAAASVGPTRVARSGDPLPVIVADEAELLAHERLLAGIDNASGGKTLWRSVI